jgi:hypothetical protein
MRLPGDTRTVCDQKICATITEADRDLHKQNVKKSLRGRGWVAQAVGWQSLQLTLRRI